MSLSSDEFKDAKKALDELKQSMAQGLKIQKDMEKGVGNYAKALVNIAEQQKNINYLESQLAETVNRVSLLKKEIADKEEANRDKIERWQKLYESGSERTKAIAAKHLQILVAQTNELKGQLDIEEKRVVLSGSYLKSQKENLELTKQQAKEASLLLATWKSLGKLPGLGKKWGFDKMKSWGIFEMDKEIRNSARSMNVGAKSFEGFSKNIGKAADTTVAWGVNAKELAKMQGGYSEAIGRSVELTQEGHKAMALMAEGTGLGTEFAVQMATEMDKFGASVSTSKDLVAATIKQASKVGVNGAAASKKLVSLLKLSQTYVFKGGQEGLKKMASDAERLKLDLEGAAGMAEKVMRPEGAVETAALLTTMGGEFAKLGDPFQLMFKARNDFAGFAKDLGKASSEFVEFNDQTGSFDIKGGLARDRMLEISKITGIQMDKLQEMAVAEKKLQMIQGNTPAGITSEEDKELIASLTEVGKGGKLMIKLRGKDPLNIDQLTPKMLEQYKLDQNTLEESAKQARTFDEVVEDLITSLKQTLLPFVQSLKENLGKPLQDLMKTWKNNGFYDTLRGFAKGAGEIASSIGKFILEHPFAALLAWKGLEALTWIKNGLALGKGFNMVARAGGMGGGMGGMAAGYGQAGGMIGPALPPGAVPPMGRMQRMMGGNVMGGKFAMGSMGSMAAGAGLGIAGMGLNAMRGDENDGFYNSGGGKALGIGSSIASGAGMGMMFGPYGALIGGLLGGAYGAYNEFSGKDKDTGPKSTYLADDALISNDGRNNGGPGSRIQFNPHDKFMSFDDVMIAGTNAGANGKLAEEIKGKGKDKGGRGNDKRTINHTGELKISGLPSGSKFGEWIIDLVVNNPKFATDLAHSNASSNNANKKGGKTPGKGSRDLLT